MKEPARKRNYHNKQPYSTLHPDPRHWTRKGNSWKAKEAYESEDDAEEWLKQHPRLISQGYRVYNCPECSKWHIGHKGIIE